MSRLFRAVQKTHDLNADGTFGCRFNGTGQTACQTEARNWMTDASSIFRGERALKGTVRHIQPSSGERLD